MSVFRRSIRAAPGVLAIVTLGATALAAVLGYGFVAIVAAVVGWFLLTPLSAVLGQVFLGEEMDEEIVVDGDATTRAADESGPVDPVERLRRRYADGDIDEAEFEHRLDLLLDTEDADAATARDRLRDRAGGSASDRAGERHRERDHELDRTR